VLAGFYWAGPGRVLGQTNTQGSPTIMLQQLGLNTMEEHRTHPRAIMRYRIEEEEEEDILFCMD